MGVNRKKALPTVCIVGKAMGKIGIGRSLLEWLYQSS